MYILMYIAGFKTSTGYFLLYYKTSQAISQSMIEKAYYHRFYSRLFYYMQYSNFVNKAIFSLTVTWTKIV